MEIKTEEPQSTTEDQVETLTELLTSQITKSRFRLKVMTGWVQEEAGYLREYERILNDLRGNEKMTEDKS